MVGEQHEGQDIVRRIEKPTVSHALNEWILEDLRSRNKEILDKEQMRNRLSTFALLALGAAVGFIVQSSTMLQIEWMIVGGFGLAVFFGFLGNMSLYFAFFEVVTSDYIRFELVPRALECLGKPTIAPYGWEQYLWEQKKESPLTMSAYYISTGALFALPSLGFTAFAAYGLYKYHVCYLKPVPGTVIWPCAAFIAVVLIWLALVGIRTSWKVVHGESRFRKQKVR